MKKLLSLTTCLTLLLTALFTFGGCSSTKADIDRYPDEHLYSIGEFEFDATIKNIDVDWEVGDITVKKTDGDNFSVTESGNLDEDEQLRYLISGSNLTIKFWQSGKRDKVKDGDKNLVIEIPQSLNNLKIENDYGNISADAIDANNVDISTDDGKITITSLTSTNAEISTDTGNITLSKIAVSNLDVESDRGDVNLTIPESGATVIFESDRGDLITSKQYNKNGRKYTFGDGACLITVETDRSDLTIN